MTPNPLTEDQLVEKLGIELFGHIGWQTVDAKQARRLELTFAANVVGISGGC
jgi:hypothetical protein